MILKAFKSWNCLCSFIKSVSTSVYYYANSSQITLAYVFFFFFLLNIRALMDSYVSGNNFLEGQKGEKNIGKHSLISWFPPAWVTAAKTSLTTGPPGVPLSCTRMLAMDPLGPVDHVCSGSFHGCPIGMGYGGFRDWVSASVLPQPFPSSFCNVMGHIILLSMILMLQLINIFSVLLSM